MNPYTLLDDGQEDQRRLIQELRAWHDEMVMHQRTVRRLGAAACSDECPHVEGRRLWAEARTLLGPAAETLTFLRACADAPRPAPAPASRRAPASSHLTTAASRP
jgi:hypothetical protein